MTADGDRDRGTVERGRRFALPSPALIVACIALVIACTGTAAAAKLLITKPTQLGRNVVTSRAVKDRSLSASDFKGTLSGDPGPEGPRGLDGPQGPAGPRGPRGADGLNGTPGKDGASGTPGTPGQQGPMGPAGFSGVHIETKNYPNVAAHSTGSDLKTTCPTAYPKVVGGGANAYVNWDSARLMLSYPDGTQSWNVWMRNDSDSSMSITVYAVCVAGS